MFSSTKIYAQVHPSFLNRAPSNLPYSEANKENYNFFAKKPQQNLNYDNNSHSNNLKARIFNPLAEARPSNSTNSGQVYDHSTSFCMSISNQNSLLNLNHQDCRHSCITKNKRTYCKDCGIFFPKSRVEVFREHIYKENVITHPDETYSMMLQKQNKNREFIAQASHLGYRKILVDWICEIGADHNFSCETVATAVSYIDTVLSKIQIPKSKLQLISLCCLIAAGKFSEMDEKVPTYKEIFELCKGTYPMDFFRQAEKLVFSTLNWDLKSVTPFNFIQFYLSKGCAFSSDQTVVRNIDAKLLRYLRKYSEFFVELSLKEYQFNAYKSNIAACAALAAARKAVGLFPLWNSELEELTEVPWRDVEQCYNQLYSCFEIAHPDIAKKANSYSQNKESTCSTQDTDSSGMSIEGAVGTPFREAHKRDEEILSSKKERAVNHPKRGTESSLNANRNMSDYNTPANLINVGIKLFRTKEDQSMSIESAGQDFNRRNSFENNIKRNLVF